MPNPPPKPGGLASRVARLWRGGTTDAPSPWLPQGVGYPRLIGLTSANLGGAGAGLYVCWHLGVRPRWLRVGGAADLPLMITGLQRHTEVTRYDANGGVFVAWAFVNAIEIPGALRSLTDALKPALQELPLVGEIAPATQATAFPLPPGTAPAVLPQAAQFPPTS